MYNDLSRVNSNQPSGKTGKMMKINIFQGKIREFVKNLNIREKSGNFTRETKKYENLG
jgi:hypothetical protein